MSREMLLSAQHVPQPCLLAHTHTHPGKYTITIANEGWEYVKLWKWYKKLVQSAVCAHSSYSLFSVVLSSVRTYEGCNNYYHSSLYFYIRLLLKMLEKFLMVVLKVFWLINSQKEKDFKEKKAWYFSSPNPWLADKCTCTVLSCWSSNQLNDSSTTGFSRDFTFQVTYSLPK